MAAWVGVAIFAFLLFSICTMPTTPEPAVVVEKFRGGECMCFPQMVVRFQDGEISRMDVDESTYVHNVGETIKLKRRRL